MRNTVLVLSLCLGLGLVSGSPGADFNGDGRDDVAVFRASSGLWSIRGITRIYFGGTGDIPAPGDYNHNGRDDIAIFRPATGLWAVRGITRVYFGVASDVCLGGESGRWLPNGSDIYYNAGQVGIGTTDPKYPLQIHKNSSSHVYVSFTNESTGSLSTDGVLVGIDPDEDFRVHSYEANNIKFFINNDEKLRIQNNGAVGIGTSSPAADLDVWDTGDAGAAAKLALHGSGTNSDSALQFYEDAAIAMSAYYDGGANALSIYDETVPAARVTFKRAGNVGIGTTSPEAKLHVYGDTTQTGLIVRGGSSEGVLDHDLATFHNGAGGLAFWFSGLGWAGANGGWETFSPYISMHFIPEGADKSDYEVGDLVAAVERRAVKTSVAYDPAAVGVICPPEGFISIPTELKEEMTAQGKRMEDYPLVPVAYTGDVRVKVNAEGGPIRSGDLIVPSSLPGVGMKGAPESFGQYASAIGKAREDFSGDSGLIWVSVGVK